MVTKEEVEQFLKGFKEKMRLTQVFFRDDRGKNAQTLADLELRPIDREKILKELKIVDYSEGPLEDTLYKKSDMWVFGKEIKKNEVYIKISMSYGEGGVLCISFHIAEYKMSYPFKD
jgi:hypothetical protein